MGWARLRRAGSRRDESESPLVADEVAADLLAEELAEFPADDRLMVDDAIRIRPSACERGRACRPISVIDVIGRQNWNFSLNAA